MTRRKTLATSIGSRWIGQALAALAFSVGNPAGATPIFTTTDLHPTGVFHSNVFNSPVGMSSSQASGVFGGQQAGLGTDDFGFFHALLWTGTAGSVVDLTGGLVEAGINHMFNGQQVGFGTQNGGQNHAALWTGTAASFVDLNPSGALASSAFATNGSKQVGNATASGRSCGTCAHAILWSGTAASAVDLHPAGLANALGGSLAFGISDSQQVGELAVGASQAALWTGTAASFVNLHPAGFVSSQALGVSGGLQVGNGLLSDFTTRHALLWSGTAASVVDLNPFGFSDSAAFGVSGGMEVGLGHTADRHEHALLWSGTANSFVDLNAFLPAGFTDAEAFAIDAGGNIVGLAYGASGVSSSHAFLWQPVPQSAGAPEPGTLGLSLLGAGCVLLGAVRRRNQSVRH